MFLFLLTNEWWGGNPSVGGGGFAASPAGTAPLYYKSAEIASGSAKNLCKKSEDVGGVCPARHRLDLPLWCLKGGACPLCRPPTLPLAFDFAPIPPTPFPGGEGGDQGYFMQGASPLASPGLNPGGAGSAGVSGAHGGHRGLVAGSPCRPCPRRGGRGGLLPLRHLVSLPRGRGPSQTPPSLATDSSISPGPPSPWLPALPMERRFFRFCAGLEIPKAHPAGCRIGRASQCRPGSAPGMQGAKPLA